MPQWGSSDCKQHHADRGQGTTQQKTRKYGHETALKWTKWQNDGKIWRNDGKIWQNEAYSSVLQQPP
jgi:hypothetical protein